VGLFLRNKITSDQVGKPGPMRVLDPLLWYRVDNKISMRIGDLAKRAGVNIQTVRFYEREKVLRMPPRTNAGYRSYTDLDLRRLVLIKRCQHLGFTLKEIRQFAALHDALPSSSPTDPKPLQAILRMAEERLRLIDEKIGGLQDMRTKLLDMIAQVREPMPGECPGQKMARN
jgi:DNA-binding transcriptional MerR regulator